MHNLFSYKKLILILLILPIFLVTVPLFSSSENEFIGKNLKEVKILVQSLNNTKRSSNPYSTPKASRGTIECSAGKTLINFENRQVRVQTESKNPNKIESISIYFISPLSKQEAMNLASDFVISSKNFKESVISKEEGNECTPREGGVRHVYENKNVIDLFYQEAGKWLIQEAKIYKR